MYSILLNHSDPRPPATGFEIESVQLFSTEKSERKALDARTSTPLVLHLFQSPDLVPPLTNVPGSNVRLRYKAETMDRLLRLGNAGGLGMGQGATPTDAPVVDTAEQVYISSLALLKMLKHGRAGESPK